jgi:hypothetical protein
MLIQLSKITAFILHPLFLFFYTIVLMLVLKPHLFGAVHWTEQHLLLVLAIIYTCVLPLIGVALLKFIGFIKDFQLKDRYERYAPIMVCSVFYLWMWMNLKSQKDVPNILLAFILGAILSLFLAFAFNVRYKVSLHALAASCVLSFWLLMRYYHCDDHVYYFRFSSSELSGLHINQFIMIFVVITGWIGTSRLLLKAHTPSEVYMGYTLGAMAMGMAYAYTF